MNEQKEPVASESKEPPQELKQQAAAYRRDLRNLQAPGKEKESLFLTALCAFLVFASLGAAVYLLTASETRQNLSQDLAQLLGSPAVGDEVFPLPAPPAREPQRAVFNQPSPSASPVGSSDERIYEGGEGDFPPAPAAEEPAFVPPAKTESSQQAFHVLQEQSEVVAQLVSGQLPGYVYQDWTLLQQRPPRFLIQLLLERETDGQAIQATWSVNVSTSEVRPESQHARDLDPPRR